ncbi:MAG: molybdopterin biosynthesis protein, partial [archaeon GB-1867-035]|nr:molybdopterin biosynthesis protein [Candidatus Culexmicrobium profundum]
MTRRIFHKLMSVEEAFNAISGKIPLKPIGYEVIELANAYGRILGEDVIANIDLPSFDRSLMDGYAVIAEDTFEADDHSPIKLKVLGKIEPGEEPKIRVKHGSAIEISTGAAIPPGANAVVMVEYTKRVNDIVEIYRPVSPSENIA